MASDIILNIGEALVGEGNEIAHNNTRGFDSNWEGGGAKFTFSENLVIRNNFSHHNVGAGLWTDIDNINITFEYNRCEDNTQSGITHETGERSSGPPRTGPAVPSAAVGGRTARTTRALTQNRNEVIA